MIDLQRFCDQGRRLDAAFPPTQLPRVLDGVADSDGEVRMSVVGFVDARGRPALRFAFQAALKVVCQRCLKPMSLELSSEQLLAFAPPGAQDDGLDDVETLPLVRQLDLVDLLEEEVILAMPMLPRHEACEA